MTGFQFHAIRIPVDLWKGAMTLCCMHRLRGSLEKLVAIIVKFLYIEKHFASSPGNGNEQGVWCDVEREGGRCRCQLFWAVRRVRPVLSSGDSGKRE